jgi:6-phosphogluconolactonase
MDPQTGALTLLSQQPSMGAGPCHLLLDKTGKNLLIANYGSGSVAVLPVDSTGQLGQPTSVIQHTGRSINPTRQEGPHAHCVALDPANQFAFVCDLGLDKVMIYRFDSATGKLTPNDPPFAPIKPGSGPRHITFHPSGKFAYVNNEMSSTVTAFSYTPTSGQLTELQTLSTLPAEFKGNSSTAEIAVHPSGRFLYVSNRGRDSLALFTIDPEKGALTYVDEQLTNGKTPRHFSLDPTGNFVLIGNQGTNQMLLCRIDPTTGRLKPSGPLIDVPSPVCMIFVPPADSKPQRE